MYISCNIGWLRPTTAANGSKVLCQTCSIKKSFCIVQGNVRAEPIFICRHPVQSSVPDIAHLPFVTHI
ncbi:unnamed protein product [Victoria cruziana]